MEIERKCENCGETLKGRSDKKFCDDYCRSGFYYHKKAGKTSSLITQTNAILRKNRQILLSLNTAGLALTSRKVLLNKGFNFGYFTGMLKTMNNSPYFFCYEMGYHSLKKEEILIVTKIDFQRLEG
ncbi:hypothetical protein DBR11_18890 [Pedobacter sp. HMWF019]|uniref:hypothetical protein n=1 Tax=Pedobacter sp. HMWF019 TaxID=2056856 RepID=UPI000D3A20C1|nr:hypothetical protein [Pedobacter sp. HMWF019]PTS96656.1 hypothetical protein DBR11_18890 [Pedobacter sp. HMWF019]